MKTGILWPLAVYTGAVVVVAAVMIAIPRLLGQRHRERATGTPYESGIPATGPARLRFSAKFYLVAMLFVIFDVEAAFIFAWAVAARELGWPGYAALVIFIAVLLAALLYLWRSGALDWGSPSAAFASRAAVDGTAEDGLALRSLTKEPRADATAEEGPARKRETD